VYFSQRYLISSRTIHRETYRYPLERTSSSASETVYI